MYSLLYMVMFIAESELNLWSIRDQFTRVLFLFPAIMAVSSFGGKVVYIYQLEEAFEICEIGSMQNPHNR